MLFKTEWRVMTFTNFRVYAHTNPTTASFAYIQLQLWRCNRLDFFQSKIKYFRWQNVHVQNVLVGFYNLAW
jgi:hypothetical protein